LPIFTEHSHGYFIYYSWNHFWKEAILSIILSLIFYGTILLLRHWKRTLFRDYEAEFGLLMVLLVGWPQMIFFIPLVLIIALILSIFNWFYKKEAMCSLFWPFILSAATLLIFSTQLENWRFVLLNF
jgi:hypothetical protein